MKITINEYKIFVYNKRANMIPMISRDGRKISRYLPIINGQTWNMSIYHISRTITYFISYHNHIISQSYHIVNISWSYHSLTYHSLNTFLYLSPSYRYINVLCHIVIGTILTLSFLSISHIHSTSICNLTLMFHEHILLLLLHYV